MSTFSLTVIIILLILAVLAFFLMNRKAEDLSKDSTGFWKYHPESQFELKKAYARLLDRKPRNFFSRLRGCFQSEERHTPVTAVIHFHGDLRAKEHDSFARIVDEIELNKDRVKEVVVVVSSPGGMVAPYGHIYSQMERIRELGIALTVCIDTVAASGGYLMSLPANKIIAAPFAVVGSVGVVAFVPNIRSMLLNWNIQPRTFTAGKYKRTVSLTDNASSEEVKRFQNQLETMHKYFIGVVKKYRPQARMDHVETGDHWTAQESIDQDLGLVDEVGCSQEYLLRINRDNDLLILSQKSGFFELGAMKFANIIAAHLENRLFRSQEPTITL